MIITYFLPTQFSVNHSINTFPDVSLEFVGIKSYKYENKLPNTTPFYTDLHTKENFA